MLTYAEVFDFFLFSDKCLRRMIEMLDKVLSEFGRVLHNAGFVRRDLVQCRFFLSLLQICKSPFVRYHLVEISSPYFSFTRKHLPMFVTIMYLFFFFTQSRMGAT